MANYSVFDSWADIHLYHDPSLISRDSRLTPHPDAPVKTLTKEWVESVFGKFDCTMISEFGDVFIWTRFAVTHLAPELLDMPISIERSPDAFVEMRTTNPLRGELVWSRRWKDFVLRPNLEASRAGRLPVDSLRVLGADSAAMLTMKSYPVAYQEYVRDFRKADYPHGRDLMGQPFRVTQPCLVRSDDALEAMVTDGCTVYGWTTRYVWRTVDVDMCDRFAVLPRDPSVLLASP